MEVSAKTGHNVELVRLMYSVVVSLVPGVHEWAERTPGFSRLHMREIFPEIWETVLFWYSSAYGIRITVLF